MRFRKQLCVLFLAVFLLGLNAILAQSPTGSIGGTITDSTGGVLPNAPVTITNKATGALRTVNTLSDGTYNVPSLPASPI